MNEGDLHEFMVEEGRFRVGDAVYADEDVAQVDAYFLKEEDGVHLVFDASPDPFDSLAQRNAQSWVLWVSLDKVKQLMALAETQGW